MEETRYKRHLMLPDIGPEGQERLRAGRVLVAGAGGLGSPVCMYLAAAGVGTIGIADFDKADISNLQRQILYREKDVGKMKVEAAKRSLEKMNGEICVRTFGEGLNQENIRRIVSGFDVVVDATDNFYTRYLISDTCMELGKPDVYGAICEFEGQVTVFMPGGPCLRCLSPETPGPGEGPNFGSFGVLGAVPGIIGSIQAAEALKLLLGIGETLAGRMLFVDVKAMRMEEMEIQPNPRCGWCKRTVMA